MRASPVNVDEHLIGLAERLEGEWPYYERTDLKGVDNKACRQHEAKGPDSLNCAQHDFGCALR